MIPKFRAWNQHEKKMVDDKELVIWGGNIYQGDRQKIFERIVEGKKGLIGYSIGDKYLMQSTGLKDKNGTEVYTGDIIKCTKGCPHEVYLEKEYGGTFIGGMPAVYLKGIKEGYSWLGVEEVIGNIYENPELLK